MKNEHPDMDEGTIRSKLVTYTSSKIYTFVDRSNLIIEIIKSQKKLFRSIELERGEGRTSERHANEASSGRRPVQVAGRYPLGADRKGRGGGFRTLLRGRDPGHNPDLRLRQTGRARTRVPEVQTLAPR